MRKSIPVMMLASAVINGTEVAPLGFSPVPLLVLAGLALLGAFVIWEQRRARLGRTWLHKFLARRRPIRVSVAGPSQPRVPLEKALQDTRAWSRHCWSSPP